MDTNQQSSQTQNTNTQDLEELVKQAEAENKLAEEAEENTLSRDEELEQHKAEALRAMADLQNFKRRAEQERGDFVKYASAHLLTALLPVLDNFKRATDAIPDNLSENEWVKGVAQIEKSFVSILEKEGLEVIEPKPQDDFDAHKHESLMVDQNIPQGKVALCLEKGYVLHGKVLRVAKVSVGGQ